MNNQPQRDNSSIWFLLGGFLSVTLIAFLNRWFSRPYTPPESPPQPIQVDVKLPEQSTLQETERVNWDVIGFASAAITLISAAIFYMAGWVYETNWYGYYGVNISHQLLFPQQVMVQGIPGVFVLGLSFLISLVIVSIYKEFRKEKLTIEDLRLIGLGTYIIVGLILVLAITSLQIKGLPIPIELVVSFILALIVYFILALLAQIKVIKHILKVWVEILTKIERLMGKQWFKRLEKDEIVSLSTQVFSADEAKEYYEALELVGELNKKLQHSQLANEKSVTENQIKGLIDNVINPFEKKLMDVLLSRYNMGYFYAVINEQIVYTGELIISSFFRMWRFWIGLLLLLLFLVSISLSAFLGVIDAYYGQRSLTGNWNLSKYYIFADIELVFSPKLQQRADNEIDCSSDNRDACHNSKNIYGPFGLIATTDQDYFLIDWPDKIPIEHRPNLYIIPRKETSNLQLFVPEPTLTPTPNPTATPTFVPTPTPSITPTPNSINIPEGDE